MQSFNLHIVVVVVSTTDGGECPAGLLSTAYYSESTK